MKLGESSEMLNTTVALGDLSKADFVLTNSEISSLYVSLAGLCSWLACFISLYEVIKHFHHFHKPYLQKYIIRIIWMIPIYR